MIVSHERQQAELLKRQSKKHALFKELLPEAEKLATAGSMYLRLALSSSDPEQRQKDLREAATLLSRAKRLTRNQLKEEKDVR